MVFSAIFVVSNTMSSASWAEPDVLDAVIISISAENQPLGEVLAAYSGRFK
jgi:hypothetical protein